MTILNSLWNKTETRNLKIFQTKPNNQSAIHPNLSQPKIQVSELIFEQKAGGIIGYPQETLSLKYLPEQYIANLKSNLLHELSSDKIDEIVRIMVDNLVNFNIEKYEVERAQENLAPESCHREISLDEGSDSAGSLEEQNRIAGVDYDLGAQSKQMNFNKDQSTVLVSSAKGSTNSQQSAILVRSCIQRSEKSLSFRRREYLMYFVVAVLICHFYQR